MKISPIIIPRGCDLSKGKLFASIVFTFPEDAENPASAQQQADELDELKSLLTRVDLDPWGFKVKFSDLPKLNIASGKGYPFRRVASAERLYPWSKAKAAWAAILPTIKTRGASAAAPPARSRTALGQRYLAFTKNGPAPDVARANPHAASEFAPGWRVESPEAAKLVATAKLHHFTEQIFAAVPHRRALAHKLFKAIHLPLRRSIMGRLAEFARDPSISISDSERELAQESMARLRKASRVGVLTSRNLAHVLEPLTQFAVEKLVDTPAFSELIGTANDARWRALPADGKRQMTVMIASMSRLSALAESAGGDLDRSARVTEAQLNRSKRKLDPEEVKNVSFRETIARFTQHPGLMRALWLAHDVELDLGGEMVENVLPAPYHGAIVVTGIESTNALPWELQAVPTYFTIQLGKADNSYFRPTSLPKTVRQADGLSCLVPDLSESETLWNRWLLIPSEYLEVSQEDGLAVAAAGDTSAALQPRSETDPRLHSEGFAFRWKKEVDRILAKEVDDRLQNARKDLPTAAKVLLGTDLLTKAIDAHDRLQAASKAFVKAENVALKEANKVALGQRRATAPGREPRAALLTLSSFVKEYATQLKDAHAALRAAVQPARRSGFYAEDLVRGLAVEGRYASGKIAETLFAQEPEWTAGLHLELLEHHQRWHRLCLRKVELYSSRTAMLRKEKPLLSIEEEGFVPTTASQAAPPVTGIVQSNNRPPADPLTQEKWLDYSASVRLLISDPQGVSMGPGPARPFWFVEPSNLQMKQPSTVTSPERKTNDPTLVRCLIRSRPTTADIVGGEIQNGVPVVETLNGKSGDRVRIRVADDHFDPSNIKQRTAGWVVREIIVSPVFEVNQFALPAEADTLQHLLSTNYARAEGVNFLFTRTGTGYIKVDGDGLDPEALEQALPPEFKRFLAEGERRFYSLGRRIIDNQMQRDLRVDGFYHVLDEVIREKIIDRQKQAIPAPGVTTPWVDTLLEVLEWPGYFLAVGIQDALDDQFRALELPFLHESWKVERTWHELRSGSGLEAVRGPVENPSLEVAGLVSEANGDFFIAGSPKIVIPANPAALGKVVRVKGAFQKSGGDLKFAPGASVFILLQNLDAALPSDEVRQLKNKRAAAMVMSVSGEPAREVEFDLDFIPAGYGGKLPNDFLKPQDVPIGLWIEAIGSSRDGRIIARGWPRLPVASVIDFDALDCAVIFADGRVQKCPMSTVGTNRPFTGRVTYPKLNAQGQAVPGADLKVTEPFRLRGELRPFQENVVSINKRKTYTSLELTSPFSSASQLRVLALLADQDNANFRGRNFREAFGDLAPRRVDALEGGDYLIVRAEAVIGANMGAVGRACFAPLVENDLWTIAAGLRGKLEHRRSSAAGVISQGGAGFDPAVITTAQGIAREIWAPVGEVIEVGGKMVTAYVSPFALLRRVIAAPLAGVARQGNVQSVAVGAAGIVRSIAHGLRTGERVHLSGITGAVPEVNLAWNITVTDADSFTIPVAVTTAGTAGQWKQVLHDALQGKFSKIEAGPTAGSTLLTTPQPHNLQTGDRIRISNHDVVALNAEWIVSVVSATTFTVPITVAANANPPAVWETLLPEAIHAGVSDVVTRWSGWNMGVKIAGQADQPAALAEDDRWTIHVEPVSPTGTSQSKYYTKRDLPLRHRRTYDFRCWQVDVAGNNGSDPEVFEITPPGPNDGVFQSPAYERVTEVQPPLLAYPPSLPDRGFDPVAARDPDSPFCLPGDFRNINDVYDRLVDGRPDSDALLERFPSRSRKVIDDPKTDLNERKLFIIHSLNECLRDESLPSAFQEVMASIVGTPQKSKRPQKVFPAHSREGKLLDAWLDRSVDDKASGNGTDAVLWLNRRLLERYFGPTLIVRAPESMTRQHRLVILTDPFEKTGSFITSSANWKIETTCYLLPPPASEETLITTGHLDDWSHDSLKALFTTRRLHAVQGMLTKNSGIGSHFSYVPDPDASRSLTKVDGKPVLPWTLFVWDGTNYLRSSLEFGTPANFQRWSAKVLSTGDSGRKKISLNDLKIDLPQGRRSFAYLDRSLEIRAGKPDSNKLRAEPDLTLASRIELIHAVTEPLERPRLAEWKLRARRVPGDTAQRLGGVVEVERPSTGAISVLAHWNEYWDETTASIQVPARAVARIEDGRITSVELRKGSNGNALAGSGFGSEAIVHLVAPGEKPNVTTKGRRFLLAPKPAFTRETRDCLQNGHSKELPALAKFRVRLVENRVEAVEVIEGGKGYEGSPVEDSKDIQILEALILQRPPLVETARARCIVEGSTGKIKGFTFDTNDFLEERRGGYYIEPPSVWLEDPEGTGRDAEIISILNGYGEIGKLYIVKSGSGYSEHTRVRISTHRYAFQEIPVEPAEPGPAAIPTIQLTPMNVEVLHAFNDPLHHRVDYMVQAASAFRDVFRDQVPWPQNVHWRKRESLVAQLDVPSSAIPTVPEPSSLWLACRLSRPGPAPSATYRVTFDLAIRVYLQRPWRAEDQLAILTGPAEVNALSDRASQDWLRLTPDLRRYVSEWAFDPAWREFELPPLHSDRFGGRVVDRIPHAHPLTLPAPPNGTPRPTPPGEMPPVSLVLYDPEWDALRREWYADVHIKGPIGGPTFVKLVVARCQRDSLPNLDLSPVEALDMVAFPGHRQLELALAGDDRLRLVVTGDLGTAPAALRADGYAERQIVVELRRWTPAIRPDRLDQPVFQQANVVPAEKKAPPSDAVPKNGSTPPPEPNGTAPAGDNQQKPPRMYIEGEYFHEDAEVDTLVLREENGAFVATTPTAWTDVVAKLWKWTYLAGKDEPYLVIKESILRESLGQQGDSAIQPTVTPVPPTMLHKGRRIIVARQALWTHAIGLSEIAKDLFV